MQSLFLLLLFWSAVNFAIEKPYQSLEERTAQYTTKTAAWSVVAIVAKETPPTHESEEPIRQQKLTVQNNSRSSEANYKPLFSSSEYIYFQ